MPTYTKMVSLGSDTRYVLEVSQSQTVLARISPKSQVKLGCHYYKRRKGHIAEIFSHILKILECILFFTKRLMMDIDSFFL